MSKIRPETRTAIIEAAFAVFSEHPAASLADVAARAGVGRATLHRHFTGRPDLMRALAEVAFAELDAAVAAATQDAPSYTEGLRLTLVAVIPLANRQWFLANEALEADPAIAKAYAEDRKELHHAFEQAKAEGAFDPQVPTLWLIEAFETLIYAAWAMVRDEEATPKQAAALAWRTLTTGLQGPTP